MLWRKFTTAGRKVPGECGVPPLKRPGMEAFYGCSETISSDARGIG